MGGGGGGGEPLESVCLASNRWPSVSIITVDEVVEGPGCVADKLCVAANLNGEQRKLVALFAWPMQREWDRVGSVNPDRVNELRNSWADDRHRSNLLPITGVLARVIFVGGGGCGKSLIINKVLGPLLRCYYGDRGLMLEAPSNKAARGIG